MWLAWAHGCVSAAYDPSPGTVRSGIVRDDPSEPLAHRWMRRKSRRPIYPATRSDLFGVGRTLAADWLPAAASNAAFAKRWVCGAGISEADCRAGNVARA